MGENKVSMKAILFTGMLLYYTTTLKSKIKRTRSPVPNETSIYKLSLLLKSLSLHLFKGHSSFQGSKYWNGLDNSLIV